MTGLLSNVDREKIDPGDDKEFYGSPRFVTHADDAFTSRVAEQDRRVYVSTVLMSGSQGY